MSQTGNVNPAVHLHVHSEYSLLDGAAHIGDLAKRAAEFGQPALGLTDHGVMNGAVDLYEACKKEGIKPILGCEVYYVDDHRKKDKERRERNHLTLLARTDEGFRNLVKLCSAGFLEGYHRGKANVDMELLDRYGSGITALTGCLQSRFVQRLLQNNPAEAKEHVDGLLQVFGEDNVYFEVQENKIPEQDQANVGIAQLAREFSRPLVGTADVHYLRREDYDHHTALLCVQTKSTLADPKMSFDTNEFYLKDSQEMSNDFADWHGAVESSLEIAERTDVTIELDKRLIPVYPTPNGETDGDFLRQMVEQGLRARYGDPVPAEARERAEMELGVIDNMGFNSYFLIVWDFVKYAKDNGIAVGPGRGSAAGSIIAYTLNITDVDPLAYNLLFERFLNAERVSMPDIDIDFSVHGREQVINYVSDKYGRESVARIITFGRMFPRAAVRDAARVLGRDYATGDRLAKLIPEPVMGRSPSFDDCLKKGEPLFDLYENDPSSKEVIDVARGLENIVRNNSIHAAAVVIADRPLTDIVPLQIAEDRSAGAQTENGEKSHKIVTQYSMKPVEKLGLLKMDFLGLRNLDVIESALDIIERSSGERPDMTKLPLDHGPTYTMLARGDSIGVFQFESEGMREALKKVKPTEFEDLIALVALYRPGAMRYIDTYARGKRNPAGVQYIDDRLRPITETSYGVVLYQEQNMQVAKDIGGFTGPQADDLRKAIGKKDRAGMAKLKEKFVEGCLASGTSQKVIDALWKMNEDAADYSFNKSHAACYGLIAYRTAWLKANYPAEYMAALISSVMSTKDKVPFFVAQCEAMGIDVLPPDVNESEHRFVVVDGNIRFGLEAVKGVGGAAVDAIIAAREKKGPYDSLWDFCERVDNRSVNKKAIESLVKCGAFSTTGASRKGMLEVLEAAQASGVKIQNDERMGQGSIFDMAGGDSPAQPEVQRPAIPAGEFETPEILAMEKETLGLFLSDHPLKPVAGALRQRTDCTIAELDAKQDGAWVTVGGLVVESKTIRTKNGSQMMFATLDDLTAQVEIIIFAKTLEAVKDSLANDAVVTVRGRVDHKEPGQTKLVVQEAEPFEPTEEELAVGNTGSFNGDPIRLVIDADTAEHPSVEALVRELEGVVRLHKGPLPLEIVVKKGEQAVALECGDGHRVARSNALVAELEEIAGVAVPGAVVVDRGPLY
ncbi:MAG: DNA polymerase III subunit alpha [Solirubrobacterales bacterium]